MFSANPSISPTRLKPSDVANRVGQGERGWTWGGTWSNCGERGWTGGEQGRTGREQGRTGRNEIGLGGTGSSWGNEVGLGGTESDWGGNGVRLGGNGG